MMYLNTSVSSLFWLHLHWAFAALALFGFIAALLWLNKHSDKKDFKNIVWTTLALGVIGSILTASAAMSGWGQMMNFNENDRDGDSIRSMMDEMSEHMDKEALTK